MNWKTDKKSFIVSGVGAERPGFEKLDAFLARYDLCENMADYSNNGKNPLAVGLDTVGDKCKKNLKWSWTSGRSGKETDLKNNFTGNSFPDRIVPRLRF